MVCQLVGQDLINFDREYTSLPYVIALTSFFQEFDLVFSGSVWLASLDGHIDLVHSLEREGEGDRGGGGGKRGHT